MTTGAGRAIMLQTREPAERGNLMTKYHLVSSVT